MESGVAGRNRGVYAFVGDAQIFMMEQSFFIHVQRPRTAWFSNRSRILYPCTVIILYTVKSKNNKNICNIYSKIIARTMKITRGIAAMFGCNC